MPPTCHSLYRYPCKFLGCTKVCRKPGGLTQHQLYCKFNPKNLHRRTPLPEHPIHDFPGFRVDGSPASGRETTPLSPDHSHQPQPLPTWSRHKDSGIYIRQHPYLDGVPCDEDGYDLPEGAPPPPPLVENAEMPTSPFSQHASSSSLATMTHILLIHHPLPPLTPVSRLASDVRSTSSQGQVPPPTCSALHLALSCIFVACLASDEVTHFLPTPPALSPFCPHLQATRVVVSSRLTSDKEACFVPPSLTLVCLQVMRAVVSSHLTSDEEARFVPPLPCPRLSASDKVHFIPPSLALVCK
ncbi:hypothetical protein BDQ17DRAFT_1429137 [Cyathus striatus]|nr:hypothetical protein BDQ17DRAFT_1429137 [Cyathus striatus]